MASQIKNDGEFLANVGQGEKKYGQEELIEIYREKLNLGLFHRLLCYLAGVAVGTWFLALALFQSNLPVWFHILALAPVWIHVCITTPRFLTLVFEDKRFRKFIYSGLVIQLRFDYAVLKPTEEERTKYPWLSILFYFSLTFPLASFALIFVLG